MNESDAEPAIWRILDCNFNRATEAVRVVEDCLRFDLADARLSERVKNMRHALHKSFQTVSKSQPEFSRRLLMMRDSENDVGRTISNDSEINRSGIRDILNANLKRFQQALRSLEEAGKVVDTQLAKSIEQIRYDAYTMEKQIFATITNQDRLANKWLCVLIDGDESKKLFEQRVCTLVDLNVPLIQLRDKQLSDRDLVERGLLIHEKTNGTGTDWIFNDRVDLALAAHADGVHLGQHDLTVVEARKILGPDKLIGLSTHSLQQVNQAIEGGADYIGVGPVFASKTKSFDQFVGLNLLTRVSDHTSIPTFAIGGIDLENAGQVFGAGIRRIAVSGMFANRNKYTDTMMKLQTIRSALTVKHPGAC